MCRLAGASRAAETARAVQLHRGPLRWLLLAAARAWPGNGRSNAPTDGGPRSVVTRSARGRLLSRGMRERGPARPARDLLRLPKTPSFAQDSFVCPRPLLFFRREMRLQLYSLQGPRSAERAHPWSDRDSLHRRRPAGHSQRLRFNRHTRGHAGSVPIEMQTLFMKSSLWAL